jgi:hypothetical protein
MDATLMTQAYLASGSNQKFDLAHLLGKHGRPVDLPFDVPFGLSLNAFLGLQIAIIVATVVLWFLLFAVVLSVTRPADVKALPANADIPGDEPPAVVSLLANRWELTEDAVESTLLDLAARHWIELRQPGNDPLQTTVHLLQHPGGRPVQDPKPLQPYEEQVLARVRSEAVGDVVPVTALTFRDPGEAKQWNSRLNASVIEDARARGLSRRRISPVLATLMGVAALVPALMLGLFVFESAQSGGGFGAGLLLWGGLSAVAGRPLGERDTPAGQDVAARWLGLRAFLRNDEAFAELPPAAVAVWDRYLSYGDALGVTRVCSALLDLGMGDRKRVWSSFGGGWHRVKVTYPRFWVRYGLTVPKVLLRAGISLVIGFFVLKLFGRAFEASPDGGGDIATDVIDLLGAYLLARGIYQGVRLGLDLAAPKTITGEVLWIEPWKSKPQKNDQPSIPLVDYFAIDDGADDRTTAWALPSEWSARCRPGDVVKFEVRPWTRRITELSMVSSRTERLTGPATAAAAAAEAAAVTAAAANAAAVAATPAAGTAAAGTAAGVAQLTGATVMAADSGVADQGSADQGAQVTRPIPAATKSPYGQAAHELAGLTGVRGDTALGGLIDLAGLAIGKRGATASTAKAAAAANVTAQTAAAAGKAPLLTVDEVSAALGRTVQTDGSRLSFGPFELLTFTVPAASGPVLTVAVARGRATTLVRRTARGGSPLAGIGDEASQGPDWVLGRRGETMIRINLQHGSGIPGQVLPGLLATAIARLP